MKSEKFDILGLGTVSVDELIVAESYPPADAKVRVRHTERQIGGLTAIALIAAARLGAKCVYAGLLGRDELSEFAINQLKKERVNLDCLKQTHAARPVHSFIVIDPNHHTRNVFSHRATEYRLNANWPPKSLIESTRVLLVDHSDLKSMLRATKIAMAANIPVVADLERISGDEFPELLEIISDLVLPQKLAEKLTGEKSPKKVIAKLWSEHRDSVVVTYGKKGSWFAGRSNKTNVLHQPIFPIEVVDTTGCGDAFHGAYAFALAKGLPLAERIRIATGVSALQASELGAQNGLPNFKELNNFLSGFPR